MVNETHKNPKLSFKKGDKIFFDDDGHALYQIKDGEVILNPAYVSYYRLGVKNLNNDTHWEEDFTLDPKKKTLFCLGGGMTRDARAANGNGNAFVEVLGLSQEEKENVQIVSCYRPKNEKLQKLWQKFGGLNKQIERDYEREIRKKFMPFMAHKVDGMWERYTNRELEENFRNIMIQAHCAGANDLPYAARVLKKTMTKLGYSKAEQRDALRQIICITNSSQREFSDNLGFTSLHRYSVFAGQGSLVYDKDYSDGYPVFLGDVFKKRDGQKMALIPMRPNEMMIVCDKILKDQYDREEYYFCNTSLKDIEHDEAYWITNEDELTIAGKYQARLMAKVGRFWYHNRDEVPNVLKLVQRVADTARLKAVCHKALTLGKELKLGKNSALINHHILKSAWNKFKKPVSRPPRTGVYKLLSDKYKD